MESPYCSCKLTRVRPRARLLAEMAGQQDGPMSLQVSHGLQLHSLWTIPTAAVS